jgi:hypothetical protein
MVNSSIQKGTSDRYKKHFEEWENFVEQFLANQDFITDSYLQGLNKPTQMECVLAFLAHLYFDKELSPPFVF